MTATPPRLLHFRVSHYNEKVRWALDFKRWPHVREALVPGFHIPRVRWLTGQNMVPVLVLDGKPLAGSAAILEEIERRRPDPPLFPGAPEERARAMELQTYFDDEVAPEVRRLFWSAYFDRPDDAARMATDGFSAGARRAFRVAFPILKPVFVPNLGLDRVSLARAEERLSLHFDRLEQAIGPSGYLVGETFGVADLAVASVMTAILRPPEFPYPLPEPWPEELVRLRDSVADRRGARWVREIYAKHRGVSCELPA